MKPYQKIFLLVLLIGLISFLIFRSKLKLSPLTGSADLSWSANADDNTAGYKIFYGENPRTAGCPPGGYAKNIDVKNSTSQKIEGLLDGKTYFFSIASYNASGQESCFSEEGQKKISFSRWERLKKYLAQIF